MRRFCDKLIDADEEINLFLLPFECYQVLNHLWSIRNLQQLEISLNVSKTSFVIQLAIVL